MFTLVILTNLPESKRLQMLDRTVSSGSEAKELKHAKKIGMSKTRHLKTFSWQRETPTHVLSTVSEVITA